MAVKRVRGRMTAVDGTKLVLLMVGGALVLVLCFQALNQFS
jgi:hypothetical protein